MEDAKRRETANTSSFIWLALFPSKCEKKNIYTQNAEMRDFRLPAYLLTCLRSFFLFTNGESAKAK
jgi:hypothetical protein